MLCPGVPFFSVGFVRLWVVPWPGVVLVGLFLYGLFVAGVLMRPVVWMLRVT